MLSRSPKPASSLVSIEPNQTGAVEKNPDRVAETLGALVRHAATAELRQGDSIFQIVPLAYSPELGIIQWELRDAIVSQAECHITMQGYNALFQFKINQCFQHGSKLTVVAPGAIVKVRQRWQRRETVLDLKIRVTSLSGVRSEHAIRDISYGGLSFFDKNREVCGELKGESITVEILLPTKECFPLRVQVLRHSGTTLDHSVISDVCHLQVVRGRRSAKPDCRWTTLINDRLHPGTKTGSRYCDEVWKLYSDCGYFELSGKTDSDFDTLKAAYTSAVTVLDNAPELGCQVVWPTGDGGEVNAAISMLKVYRNTWLGFQMARTRTKVDNDISGRRILREIHLRAYEHAQLDPDLQWVLGYTQVKKVWSRLVHYELPLRYVEQGDASILRFRALQFEVDDVPETRKPETVLDRPTAMELFDLAETIAETRPPSYCEALDLVPERMAMARIRQLYGRQGLSRDRAVFVVRHLGIPMAAAVVEMGADGLHLFGLLDLVRLYPLSKEGEGFYTDLLGHCADWFQARDKEGFCLYLEDGQELPQATVDAATDMGEADMIILSAKRLPELLEHLHEVTSPRTKKIEISEADPQ